MMSLQFWRISQTTTGPPRTSCGSLEWMLMTVGGSLDSVSRDSMTAPIKHTTSQPESCTACVVCSQLRVGTCTTRTSAGHERLEGGLRSGLPTRIRYVSRRRADVIVLHPLIFACRLAVRIADRRGRSRL